MSSAALAARPGDRILVVCLTNKFTNLLVLFAAGCVALPRVAPAAVRVPTTKILRIFVNLFVGHATAIPLAAENREQGGGSGSSRGN